MRIKSYFAHSLGEAIDRARAELGSDAMLMSSKAADPALRELGPYEVVFSVGEAPNAAPVVPVVKPEEDASKQILRELQELRSRFEAGKPQGGARPSEDMTVALSQLQDAGFSHEIAGRIANKLKRRTQAQPLSNVRSIRGERTFAADLLHASLFDEIKNSFDVAPILEQTATGGKPVFFAGPHGAGKTSSLIKLALQQGLRLRTPTHLLSLDTLRMGGCDQLSTFARVAGLDFEAVQHLSLLERAIEHRMGSGLILIDTPPLSRDESLGTQQLARAIAALAADVHLVLPASTSWNSAEQIRKQYEIFRPAKLLLTRVDEAEGCALPIEFAMRLELPLSFFGCGDRIPEDIYPVDKERLLQSIQPQLGTAARAA